MTGCIFIVQRYQVIMADCLYKINFSLIDIANY